MRIATNEPVVLKNMVSIIAEIVNECKLKVEPKKLSLIAMDPANVAMVIMEMNDNMFHEYDVKGEEDIGLNLTNFKQILNRCGSGLLSLETKENKLVITQQGQTVKTFSLPMIDLEDKPLKAPPLQYSLRVLLPSSVLRDSIDDAEIVGESLKFSVTPDKFSVVAEGDLNSVNIEIPKTEENKIFMDGEKQESRYSVEYLKKIMGGVKIADVVSFRLMNNYPLTIEFRREDKCMLTFILAPRVENE